MTVYSTIVAADAKAAIDLVGDSITYIQDGADNTVNAIPQAETLEEHPTTGGRNLITRVVINIAKADIADVKPNEDAVIVPSSWWGITDGTTTRARVAAIIGSKPDPGSWRLELVRETD